MSNHSMLGKGAGDDWLRLQKKIFTRWVNQRLATRRLPPMEDVVADLGKGRALVDLLEILSEKPYTGKLVSNPRFKAQHIENNNNALKFVWECGVEMKMKPSAENLFDGDEKDVLGLIWALMMKYLRFSGDDEEQVNAKDALLRWVSLNTQGYNHVEIKSFKTSFKSGMALCAIIHKHRPALIDYESLDPTDNEGNLQKAMTAAEAYFELEQYLTPADILKLDEKSMLVYVSEYYTGIQEQRKLDLAARRIKLLVDFTVTNDQMKAKYEEDAAVLRKRIEAAEHLMAEFRIITNTMDGAEKKLKDFNSYRTTEKRALFSDQIGLEALYTNLATRLSDNNRPEFNPSDTDLTLHSLVQKLEALQELEYTVGLELHTEMSRQLRLKQIDTQHASRYDTLMQWLAEHKESLPVVESVTSSGAARHALKFLESYEKESAALKSSSVQTLKAMGAELTQEKFEHIEWVMDREHEVDSMFVDLDQLAVSKKPLFQDALERETFKEKTRLSVKVHADLCKQIHLWGDQKKAFLNTKETVNNSADAELHLGILEAYRGEKSDMGEGSVKSLKDQGTNIRAAEYKSEHSQWKYEKPQDTVQLEASVDKLWVELSSLSDNKQKILEDDLARELYAEETRMLADQHEDKVKQILAWAAEKLAYLQVREDIQTVELAHYHIAVLEAFRTEKITMTASTVHSLKQLGQTVLARKYSTTLSSYVYEKPEDVKARETEIDSQWTELDSQANIKAPILQDHLDRNMFQNKIRLWVKGHSDKYMQISSWVDDRRKYLKTKEVVESVQEAQLQLSLLAAYVREKIDMADGSVVALTKQGDDIRAAKYETQYSNWVYEKPEDVTSLEEKVQVLWEELSGLSDAKQLVLEDDLAREQLRRRIHMKADRHSGIFQQLENEYVAEKTKYLDTVEEIDSIADAQLQISLNEAFDVEIAKAKDTTVASLKDLGNEITTTTYETDYSKWVFPDPASVTSRESSIDKHWATMVAKSTTKATRLKADLEREVTKENLRLDFASQATAFEGFVKDTCIFVGSRRHLQDDSNEASGFTLEQFLELVSKHEEEAKEILKEAISKEAAYEDPLKKLESYGPIYSPYTPLTRGALQTKHADLKAALESRQKAHDKEVQRLREDEQVCKEFANKVNPLMKQMTESMSKLTSAKGTLDEQLTLIDSLIHTATAHAESLEAIRSLDAQQAERGITYNRFCTLTFNDLQLQLKDYSEILSFKKPLLEKEIEYKKLKGVTPEQLQEIQDFFTQFDKDGSGSIEQKELKACLYSLGEELTTKGVKELVSQFSSNDELSWDQFKNLMLHLIGVSHTQDNILQSFTYIAQDEENIAGAKLEKYLEPSERTFIQKTAPAVTDNKFAFVPWVEAVFSR